MQKYRSVHKNIAEYQIQARYSQFSISRWRSWTPFHITLAVADLNDKRRTIRNEILNTSQIACNRNYCQDKGMIGQGLKINMLLKTCFILSHSWLQLAHVPIICFILNARFDFPKNLPKPCFEPTKSTDYKTVPTRRFHDYRKC